MARRRRTFGTAKRDEWVREFMRRNASLRRYVLREIERNGPLLSRDLKYEAPADTERHAWWGRGDLRLLFEMLAVRRADRGGGPRRHMPSLPTASQTASAP